MISEAMLNGRQERPPGSVLLFVTGLAHSGKTELARLLALDSRIDIVRRAYFWTRHYGRYGDLAEPANRALCAAELGRDHSLEASTEEVLRTARFLSDSGAPLTYGSLFAALHGDGPNRARVIQLRGAEMLAARLLTDLHGARIVHLVRDPRQMLGSSRRAGRVGRRGWDLAAWAHSARMALHNRGRFGDRYWVLRWEELVSDPSGVVGRLTESIGFEPNQGGALPTIDAGSKQSPSPASFIPLLEGLVGPELASLGYSVGGASRSPLLSGVVDRAAFKGRLRFGFAR